MEMEDHWKVVVNLMICHLKCRHNLSGMCIKGGIHWQGWTKLSLKKRCKLKLKRKCGTKTFTWAKFSSTKTGAVDWKQRWEDNIGTFFAINSRYDCKMMRLLFIFFLFHWDYKECYFMCKEWALNWLIWKWFWVLFFPLDVMLVHQRFTKVFYQASLRVICCLFILLNGERH